MSIITKVLKKVKEIFSQKKKNKKYLDYSRDYWFPNGPDGSKAFYRKIKIDKIWKLGVDITHTHWNITGSKNKMVYSIPIGSNDVWSGYHNISIGKWNISFGNLRQKRIEKINKIFG